MLLTTSLAACKKDKEEPAPSAVSFRLVSALFNGNAIDPLPDYQITLHFDAAANPTQYESIGTAAVTPTPATSGSWQISGNKVQFSSADHSREVELISTQISPLSSQMEVSWSMGKTEIPWPQVGDYTYSFQRVE